MKEVLSQIILKFDGSIGPTNEWTCMGWAYLIEFEGGLALRNFGHKFVGRSNVTVAEFEGLLHGLNRLQSLGLLRKHLSARGQARENVPTVLVQGDSETVIDLLMQKDSSKVKKGLKPFYIAALKLLREIDLSWKAEKISKPKNGECDGLAHAELEACLRESISNSLANETRK
jgi:ribonuclease HI